MTLIEATRQWNALVELIKRRRFLRIVHSVGTFPANKSWVWRLQLGNGAGYLWGATLWIGRNVKGRKNDRDQSGDYRVRPWSLGFTRNGNHTPYPMW